MTASRVVYVCRKLALPAVLLVLAVGAAGWGEHLLSTLGLDAVGPLSVNAAAVSLAIAFGILCVVTMVLALSQPGTAPNSEGAESEPDLEEALAFALAEISEGEEQPRGKRVNTEAREDLSEVPPEVILETFKRAAIKASQERADAEADRDAAVAQATRAQERMEALYNGTSPEAQALTAKLREEINAEAMAKVLELNESSERLVASLKDAKDRTEAELTTLRTRTEEEIASLKHAKEVETAQAYRDGAAQEYLRVQVALLALNDTHLDVLDPMQKEAVANHQARIVEAFHTLAHGFEHEHLPDVVQPAVSAEAPVQSAPPVEEWEHPQAHSPAKQRRLIGRLARN